MPSRRGLRYHRITGRSGTASGSTTDGTSPSEASEAMISTCSQQIWRRWPNGIQHWAKTRSVSERSPAPLSRITMVRAGCSGMRAAMVSPSAETSSRSSARTIRVMVQARRTPSPLRLACCPWSQRSARSRRILSGKSTAAITVSSRCGRGGPAWRRRRPVPRCRRRNWGNRNCARARCSGWARPRAQLASTISWRV